MCYQEYVDFTASRPALAPSTGENSCRLRNGASNGLLEIPALHGCLYVYMILSRDANLLGSDNSMNARGPQIVISADDESFH